MVGVPSVVTVAVDKSRMGRRHKSLLFGQFTIWPVGRKQRKFDTSKMVHPNLRYAIQILFKSRLPFNAHSCEKWGYIVSSHPEVIWEPESKTLALRSNPMGQ